MASFSAIKPRHSATSFPPRGSSSSPSPFASSSTSFMSRPSSATYGKYSSTSTAALAASAVSSVKFQNDQRSASPGRSISVQKNRDKNANTVPSIKKKVCMCSPSKHPGAFRCSLHKNSSNNSVNVANRSQFQNRSLNNILRRAMANSIVRIGGVEGADLVKRSLSALIRPCLNSQRRHLGFQARPSRLSTMSRAEEV